MIVDASALLAMVHKEPGWNELARVAALADCRMSTANWLEASIVTDARSAAHGARFDRIVELLEIEVVPVGVQHAAVAREAYRRFGRGSGSRARLNFGDCFSYALAVVTGEKLLFVGEDFTHTDVAPAMPT